MTITRQDLEDAAKAVGIEYTEHMGDLIVDFRGVGMRPWNPVTNKADTFDLAMKCGMSIMFLSGFVWTILGKYTFTPGNMVECCEAVVLAAAEMERSKGNDKSTRSVPEDDRNNGIKQLGHIRTHLMDE